MDDEEFEKRADEYLIRRSIQVDPTAQSLQDSNSCLGCLVIVLILFLLVPSLMGCFLSAIAGFFRALVRLA